MSKNPIEISSYHFINITFEYFSLNYGEIWSSRFQNYDPNFFKLKRIWNDYLMQFSAHEKITRDNLSHFYTYLFHSYPKNPPTIAQIYREIIKLPHLIEADRNM